MRLILILFIAFYALSADLNTTLIDADAKLYQSLLSNLKKNKSSAEAKLQEALLYKLINISQSTPPKPFSLSVPRNQQEYKTLLIQTLNWLEQKDAIAKNLQDLEDKLATIHDQITQENNTTSALTLQLQAAFYTKAKNLLSKKLSLYDNAINNAPSIFIKALHHLRLDANTITSNRQKIQKAIQDTQKQLQKIEIEIERLSLLDKKQSLSRLQDSAAKLQQKIDSLRKEEIVELLMAWSKALQQKDSKAVFHLHHQIIDLATRLFPSGVVNHISNLLSYVEKALLGSAAVLKKRNQQNRKPLTHHYPIYSHAA